LTVIARRVVVRELLKQPGPTAMRGQARDGEGSGIGRVVSPSTDRSGDREEIERLLEELDGAEAEIVRMYHLEGKSYHEISTAVGMPENSVGPTLSRARSKMRRAATEPSHD
jgi:RNA polymerase sigma-70 factor (ECF subfamily)